MKKFNITVNGTAYDVEVEEVRGGAAAAPRATAPAPKAAPAPAAAPAPKAAPAPAAAPAGGAGTISAPMPGKIIDVKVSVGQAVKAGDTLLILEAMKMQNEIPAVSDGTVKSINVSAGQSVKAGDPMIEVG